MDDGVGRWVAAVAALLIGFSLIVLAVPRAVAYAGIVSWSGIVPDALDAGTAIPMPSLQAAHSDYCCMATYLPADANLIRDCARLGLWVLDQETDVTPADVHAAFVRSVTNAPNRSFHWAMLGLAEERIGGPEEKIVSYAYQARLTGPYLLSSLILRTPLALRHWSAAPEDMRFLFGSDMRSIWLLPYGTRGPLTNLYINSSFRQRVIIRDYVIENAEEEKNFDRRILYAIKQMRRPAQDRVR